MRKLLLSLVCVGLISGCLSTHNTDGKTRPDDAQHTAHINSYNKFVKVTAWGQRRSNKQDDLEREADLAWARRNLSWSEYQDSVLASNPPVPVRSNSCCGEIAPVKTLSRVKKPVGKPSGSISGEVY